eukprot:TRINITY_DN10015_c1_g4_i2.p1 TRINITY_DN10015_c1_g4~~TRINITY_DN10015_c1_g4_i2.p1  ORF type:complete len:773 (-),score=26.21 TRINITY_DN10015_c1_g4_i2:215-2365(-)
MTIEDNITYETKGHCFLLGEGAEMFNVFRRNLGINARKVVKVIPSATGNRLDFQTDQQPTTFWLATPFSSFYDNVAAGSEDSGFWLEANPYMRGLSRLLPRVGSRIPFYFNWGEYDGNTAHSNKFGFRTYPHGSKSRYPVNNGAITKLSNLLLYRNTFGIFFFNSERVTVQNGAFVDNAVGIDLSRNAGITSLGCRFIGRTARACSTSLSTRSMVTTAASISSVSRGPTTAWELPTLKESLGPYNPYADTSGDDDFFRNKTSGSGTASAATLSTTLQADTGDDLGLGSESIDPASEIGSKSFGSFASPMGITLSQSNPQDNLFPNSIQDTSFHAYGTCSSSSFGLVLLANHAGGYWNSAINVKGLSFGPGTKKFWATPNPDSGVPPRGGLIAYMYALRDLDGSLIGSPGYAVAPYDPILPPPMVRNAKCSLKSAFSVYACSSVCYRSVGLLYSETGVRPNGMSGLPKYVLRPYSYISITRVEDGAQFKAYGTDNDNPVNRPAGSKTARRAVIASLLAGYTYRFVITPAPTNQLFYPTSATLMAYDRGGCSGSVNVIVEAPSGKQWTTDAPTIPCSAPDETRTYKQYLCQSSKSKLSFDVGATSSGSLATLTLNSASSSSCTSDSACSTSTSSLPKILSSPINTFGTGTDPDEDPFYDASFYSPQPNNATVPIPTVSGGNSNSSAGSSSDGSLAQAYSSTESPSNGEWLQSTGSLLR